MTTSHSCINTRGMMYDSSVLVWSNEWLTGNYGDWVQVPFVKNLAPWPPTNRWTYCCPKMTLFKTTPSYIKRICRFFCYSHFKGVNLTWVWMGLPFSCMHWNGKKWFLDIQNGYRRPFKKKPFTKKVERVIWTMFKPTAGWLQLDINSLLVNIYTDRYVGNEGIYIVFGL